MVVAGGPGAPSPPAAAPVEEAPGHGQGSARTQQAEELSVLGKHHRQKPATRKNVPTHTAASFR